MGYPPVEARSLGASWLGRPEFWVAGLALAALSLGLGYFIGLDPDWLHFNVDLTRRTHVAGLLAGAILAIAILKWPELGLLGLLAVIFTNSSEVAIRFHHLPSPLQLFVPIVAIAVVMRFVLNREQKLVIDPILIFLALYGVVIFTSTVNATAPEIGDAALFDYVKNLVLVLVIINLVTSKELLHKSVWVLILSGAFLGTISAYQVITGSYDAEFAGFGRIKFAHIVGSTYESRIAGPLSDPNFYAQALAALVPMTLYRLRDETALPLKAIAGYALVAVVVTVIISYSRAGAVAVGVTLALVAIQMRVRFRYAAIGAAILAASLALLPGQFSGRLSTLDELFPEGGRTGLKLDSSFEQRKLYMRTAWYMFDDRPLLGVGAGNYADDYYHYADQAGSTVSTYDEFGYRRFPHSLYLQIAAETGIAGLAAFAGILALTLWSFGKAYVRFTRAGDRRSAGLVAGLAFGFISYLMTSVFLHDDYMRYFWVLVAMAIAAKHIASRREPWKDEGPLAGRARRPGIGT